MPFTFLAIPNTSTAHNQHLVSNSESSVLTGSTISFTSGVLSSDDNTIIQNQCDKFMQNFNIPWEKFPKIIMDLCNSGQKLGIYSNTLVRILVDELREKSIYIPVSVFRKVIALLTAKFPDTFLEKDEAGQIISLSNNPLLTKLINHNNYLNRNPKRLNSLNANIPINKRRKTNTIRKTCKNWQPENYDAGENLETVKEKKLWLQKISSNKNFSTEEWTKIKMFMSQTFSEQRLFLNQDNTKSVTDVMREWPFLVKKEIIFEHFEKLTGSNITNFFENFEEKKQKILNFFENKYKDISKEEDISFLKYLSKYFKENEKFFITFYEVSDGHLMYIHTKHVLPFIKKVYYHFQIGTSIEAIDQPTNTPWIAAIGIKYVLILKFIYTHMCFTSFLDSDRGNIYYLFADNVLVNSSSATIVEAFAQDFCLYFILNIAYPKKISQLLEFCQRYFFNIHTENSRGEKKNLSAVTKVMSLISKIKMK